MSVKAIREYDAKMIIQKNWDSSKSDELGIKGMMIPPEVLEETEGVTWGLLVDANPWVKNMKLVAKPDQLVKRRGKLGLVAVNLSARIVVPQNACPVFQNVFSPLKHVFSRPNNFQAVNI